MCKLVISHGKVRVINVSVPNLSWAVGQRRSGVYQISAGCGTGCEADYFFTPPHTITGPWSVMALNKDGSLFATYADETSQMLVYSVDGKGPLCTIPLKLHSPQWSGHIVSAKFVGKTFIVTYVSADDLRVTKKCVP